MQDLYSQWLDASAALAAAKKHELELRNAICDTILTSKLEGAVTKKQDGLKITATAKLNRSIDREVLEAIYEDLTDQEKEAIDYKPALRMTAYKKLEAEGCKLMEAITVKPAQATLKIVVMEDE